MAIPSYDKPPRDVAGVRSLLGQESYVVPANAYFVIGDNWWHSCDSRDHGAVPLPNIIGKVTRIYWPLGRAGALAGITSGQIAKGGD